MTNAAVPLDGAGAHRADGAGAMSRRQMLLLGGTLTAGLALGAHRRTVVDDPVPGVPDRFDASAVHGAGRSRVLPSRRGRKGFRPRPPYPLGKVIGAISIPALGVDDRLYSGIDLWVLDNGPGHWPGTPLPGQPGNCVVAGHRVSHSKPFRYIDTLKVGDTMVLSALGLDHLYVANNAFIVEPTGVEILGATADPVATIFACHPPGSVDLRYVVTFVKVDEAVS
jgi:LPXTG-site transpeptidase (sortase) family protein